MNSRNLVFYLVFTAGLLTLGCNESLPEGINKVIPVKIKVLLDGSPLPEADIQLFGSDAVAGIAISGQTNTEGVAVLRSVKGNWIKTGAPTGNYKVTIQKVMPVKGEKSAAEIESMSIEEKKAYYVQISQARQKAELPFPKTYTSSKTTPLTLEIDDSSVEIPLSLDSVSK
ncbi:MAG: hypothetical protein Q4G68_07875 [Planctomycetia bacterium]|nr:hypothetical protein [Planctomycetia bacterium]